MPYDLGLEMILKRREKEIERLAWELWISLDEENKKQTSYKDLLEKMKNPPQNTDHRTDEEIINDAEHIISLLKRSE